MFSKPPSSDPPVTDQDLHAFVDGELDGRRYRRVVQHLAVDPYAAERVGAMLRQQGGFALLREHLADVEPPEDDRAKELARRLAGAVRHQRRVRLTSVASGLALSLLAGSLVVWGPAPSTLAGRFGWSGGGDGPHVLFGREQADGGAGQHLVGAGGADDALGFDQQLAEAYAVRRPDLAAHGLTFAGGNMLKGGPAPAVRLVYEDETGRQVFLFIGAVGDDDDVALTLVPEGHVSFNWRRGSLVFALIGPKESEELLEVMRSTGDFLAPAQELPAVTEPATGTTTVLEATEAVTSGAAGMVTVEDPAPPGAAKPLLPGEAAQAPLPVPPAAVIPPAPGVANTSKAL